MAFNCNNNRNYNQDLYESEDTVDINNGHLYPDIEFSYNPFLKDCDPILPNNHSVDTSHQSDQSWTSSLFQFEAYEKSVSLPSQDVIFDDVITEDIESIASTSSQEMTIKSTSNGVIDLNLKRKKGRPKKYFDPEVKKNKIKEVNVCSALKYRRKVKTEKEDMNNTLSQLESKNSGLKEQEFRCEELKKHIMEVLINNDKCFKCKNIVKKFANTGFD